MKAVGLGLVALGAGVVASFGVPSAADLPLGPAYDVVTVSSLRNLSVALQSYGLMNPGRVPSVAELHDWGWEPPGTAAVVIEVSDGGFEVVAKDVRPGSTTYRLVVAEEGADGPTPVGPSREATSVPGVVVSVTG